MNEGLPDIVEQALQYSLNLPVSPCADDTATDQSERPEVQAKEHHHSDYFHDNQGIALHHSDVSMQVLDCLDKTTRNNDVQNLGKDIANIEIYVPEKFLDSNFNLLQPSTTLAEVHSDSSSGLISDVQDINEIDNISQQLQDDLSRNKTSSVEIDDVKPPPRKRRRREKNPGPPPETILPPCTICDEKSSGYHYGVNTCEACKGFFRRTLKKTEIHYKCKCKPDEKQAWKRGPFKNGCPACRYERCLAVGMSKNAIKIGRYTLDHKTKNIKEVKHIEAIDSFITTLTQPLPETRPSTSGIDMSLLHEEPPSPPEDCPEPLKRQKATDMESLQESSLTEIFPQSLQDSSLTEISPGLLQGSSLSEISLELLLESSLLEISQQSIQESSLIDISPQSLQESSLIEISPQSLQELSLIDISPQSLQESSLIWISPGPYHKLAISLKEIDSVVKILTEAHTTLRFDERINIPTAILKRRQKEYCEKYHLKMELFGNMRILSKDEYRDFYNVTGMDIDGRLEQVHEAFRFFEQKITTVIDFAKAIPGFKKFSLDDQAKLVKASRIESSLVSAYKTIMRNVDTERRVFTTPWGTHMHLDEIQKWLPLDIILKRRKLTKQLLELNLTVQEDSVVRAIVIVSSDRCTLDEPQKVDAIQENLVACLQHLLNIRPGGPGKLLYKIFNLLTNLREFTDKTEDFEKIFFVDWPMLSIDKYHLLKEFVS